MELNPSRRDIALAVPAAALALGAVFMNNCDSAPKPPTELTISAAGSFNGLSEQQEMRSQLIETREAEAAREQAEAARQAAAAERAKAARERAAELRAQHLRAARSRHSLPTKQSAHIQIHTNSGATAKQFAELRQCESGGNYQTNTGNGYYGAYQFDLRTFHGLGYSGRPDQASPSVQDAAARELQSERGWSPWPSCARQLGFIAVKHG